ncbi:MAG: response regulator transcription factor [Lewinellaceae bacterium]|nr:response regulator transcription factor [Lewinellaceae bacterium]
MRPIHVHITEDQPRLAKMLRENLELSPGFVVSGWAENGEQLLAQLEIMSAQPDIVLMDIKMPVMDGIAATRNVKNRYPQIKVVMATVFDDEANIFDAILAGADGYLLKDSPPDVIHQAMLEVLEGGAPMSPAIARKALVLLRKSQAPTPATEDHDLSPREIELLEQLSKGLRYDQVAANLNISTGTVRKHIEHIYRKLQVHNKTAAVEAAKRKGVI